MKKYTGYKKSILFSIGFLFFTPILCAQEPVAARQFFEQKDLAFAKQSIDSFVQTYSTVAAGWLLKAAINNAIAKDASFSSLAADGRMDAFSALQKAVQLNAADVNGQLKTGGYNLPFELYDGITNDGLAYYNAGIERNDKVWFNEALHKFKNAALVSQFIYQQGWGLTATDTSNWYYAAKAAINAGNEVDAQLFAKKIADAGITNCQVGTGFEGIYQWLAYYYKKQKDDDHLIKYAQLGMSLFPASVYFDLLIIDWERQQQHYTRLLQAYEQLLKKQPDSTVYELVYCNELFNYLYNAKTSVNARSSYEDKLKQGLVHYLTTNPGSAEARLLLGKMYINLYNEKAKQGITHPKTENNTATDDTTAPIALLRQSNKYLKEIISSFCQTDIKSCKEAKQLLRYNLQRMSPKH